MSPAATAPVFSPSTRFLPLFTFEGRHRATGRMHLARTKSTKKPVTEAWCGRPYFVGPKGTISGSDAVVRAWAEPDEQPTCKVCLDRVRAWQWSTY